MLLATARSPAPDDTDGDALLEQDLAVAEASAEARGPLGQAPDGAPNILVLMWDTARADRMSLYGHERPTTPRLDAFASEARVYESAYAPSFWTVPSSEGGGA